MKNSTLFVNLFAGPGCGKSTTAAGLFYTLKNNGYNAELIQEYAKDKVWGEDFKTLKFQPYILGKQLYRQFRLVDQVDIAVTDSPVLFSYIYKGLGWVEGMDDVVLRQFNLFNNLNIFLVRNNEVHPYNPKGRTQTEQEAEDLDSKIEDMLRNFNIHYHKILVSSDGSHIEDIFNLVQKKLNFV
jgi:nicotinamide riboside kinase